MKLEYLTFLFVLADAAIGYPIRNRKGYLTTKTVLKTIPKSERLFKRVGYYNTPLQNEIFEYVATFDVGTPGQTVEAMIDTGSSDLWVYTNSSGQPDSYLSNSSSTYNLISKDFAIQYVSGSVRGSWVKDTLSIDGAVLTQQQFATVDEYAESPAVFGIGFQSDESVRTKYTNVPQNLVDQGYLDRNAYSLYLDNINAAQGALLFGAVDSAKYTGQLYTLPLTDTKSFQVDISSVSIGGRNIGTPFKGILDSGTSLSYLPISTVALIASYLGATYDSTQQAYFFDKVPTQNLIYNFSGATVTIAGSELAIPASDFGVTGTKPYVLSIFPNSQSSYYNLLGDSFLRSAYVVYDLDKSQVSIAQASWNSHSSNIKVIGDTVPGAQMAPGVKSATHSRRWAAPEPTGQHL